MSELNAKRVPPSINKSGLHDLNCIYYVLLLWFAVVIPSVYARSICHRGPSFDRCLWQHRMRKGNYSTSDDKSFTNRTINIPIYGNLHEYAYYYTVVEIGTPPQRQTVVIDTGSPNLVVASALCKHCGEHDMTPLNLNDSRTASRINWDNPFCTIIAGIQGKGGSCQFEQVYAEESVIRGEYVSDYFMFANETSPNIMYNLQNIGSITGETGPIYDQKANGVLGLSLMDLVQSPMLDHVSSSKTLPGDNIAECNQRSDHATNRITKHDPSKWSGSDGNIDMADNKQCNNRKCKVHFIEDYLHWHFQPKRHVFSLCLSENGGLLTFGGYRKNDVVPVNPTVKHRNGKRFKSPLIWIPLAATNGYSINVAIIEFAGYRSEIINHNFVIDSGSTNSLLESSLHSLFVMFYTNLCNIIKNNEHHDVGDKFGRNTSGHNPRYAKYDDTTHDLYAKLPSGTRCTIHPTMDYLCFSNISQMPAIRLVIKGLVLSIVVFGSIFADQHGVSFSDYVASYRSYI